MKLLRKQCEVCDVIKDEKQASGFSVLTADELYYVNGGSFSWSGLGSAVAVGAGTGAITGVGAVSGALVGAAGYFISIMFD